ncbi:hypothetical protein NX784_02050 [Massilia pinisoli]|uniref:Aldose 1-epimerase n=1 Tax=Massilia pinisoli TaxID=1772194 RepID=A0ABT1ZKD5_9BURK|nr:hypothetical protein [Massilia pinisoli]MCS0580367.1 hypothetical protein [Massilia pinisoli]
MTGPWRLAWEHGSAEVQSLGGMLGPLSLRIGDERELDIMHVAPWAGMTRASRLPGLMRRLRGEWPCVPFGCTEPPHGLPADWRTHAPEDGWNHGYAANHHWRCVSATGARIHLAIDYPAGSPIEYMEREIAADPHAPAVDIVLRVWARRPARVPAGLHPTFRLPPAAGRVRVALGPHAGIHSYPAQPAGAVSRLLADTMSPALDALAGVDGPIDLAHLPLAAPAEELVQVRAVGGVDGAPPLALHYLDYDACVGLWWDTAQLPDLLLWVSNGGRIHFPWMSSHLALGAEPVNSLFDLGRVATAPAGHPLADRHGIAIAPSAPWETRYRIAAWPQAASPTSD